MFPSNGDERNTPESAISREKAMEPHATMKTNGGKLQWRNKIKMG